MEIELDPKQAEAVNTCCDLKTRIVAVTGQAGTGKTTIMRQVFNLLTDKGYRVALAAPTGKAAKRIQEATGIPAMTIHRLLEYTHPGDRDPKTGKPYGISKPTRTSMNPLEKDVVLVDEYAMVNHELHRAVIDALPGGGSIRAFGDINQLPPIEPSQHLTELPSPFADILHRFTGIKLDINHRQGTGSGIVENGQRINRGITPVRKPDFDIITTDEPLQRLEAYLFEGNGKGSDWDTIQHQIITPTNKGWTGTYAINQFLQRIYRRDTSGWLTVPRHEWHAKMPLRIHVGDKVIYEVNNYDLELFNGEGGIVEEITDYGEIVINLGDRTVAIPPWMEYTKPNGDVVRFDPRRDLSLAYAITTHKAQGSEYESIIYILNKSSFFIQLRSNFYTAITRAKNRACLIGDIRSITASVQRTKPFVPKVVK